MRALDNKGKEYIVYRELDDFIIKKDDINTDADYIDIYDAVFDSEFGEEGYYVVADADRCGSYLCRFTKKDNFEFICKQNLMPIFGVKKEEYTIMGIIKNKKQDFFLVVENKNGKFSLKLRFEVTQMGDYEDIRFSILHLGKNADYSDMAIAYREYQLNRGECVPLRKRAAENKELMYAIYSPEIRIRLGWKPAPPSVLEQTPKNEPDMKVACTFDRVKDLINELERQGVDKAQICLVGWNKSGHDGRYPQIFPVEEKLGGETKLRELISYAKKKGYQVVCHTNSTDCYSIADTFSEDIVCKTADGNLSVNDIAWSGGTMYNMCPEKAWEYAKSDLPKVSELGFRGIHYIDVISTVPLRECYDRNHMCNKKQALDYYNKIMKLSHKEFGGFASEGAFDFAAKYLDYALYVSFSKTKEKFLDEEIPLWQIVYHGIILSNSSTETVNYTIKGTKAKERFLEYGDRPTFYLYSKFMNGSNLDDWLGSDDLICDTDIQLKYTVSKIKEAYEEYKKKVHLQFEYIKSHKNIDDKFEVVYSNGVSISNVGSR